MDGYKAKLQTLLGGEYEVLQFEMASAIFIKDPDCTGPDVFRAIVSRNGVVMHVPTCLDASKRGATNAAISKMATALRNADWSNRGSS